MTTTVEPDVRLRQRAAANLHRLLADVDYLATPEQADAATTLARAARRAHSLLVSGQLAEWKDNWDQGSREPIAATADEQADAVRLARAVLTVHQRLTGPAANLADGIEVRAGDQLRVAPRDVDHIYTRAGHRLDTGALATITAIDTDQHRLTLEIPTAGCTIDIDLDDPAARTLEHAYTAAPTAAPDRPEPVAVGVTARDRSLGASR